VEEAWDKYRNANGNEERESFINRMNSMFGMDTDKGHIGCIILRDFKVFENPVFLRNINIRFANSTISGMGITNAQVTQF
jgi:hypothetical protein